MIVIAWARGIFLIYMPYSLRATGPKGVCICTCIRMYQTNLDCPLNVKVLMYTVRCHVNQLNTFKPTTNCYAL